MRVLVLSVDINISPLGLEAALERESSVSHVEASDDIQRALDADIAVFRGAWSSELLALGLRSGSCVRVVVADHAIARERIRLLDEGADVVLHGDVPDDEVATQIRAIVRRRSAPVRGVGRTGGRKDKLLLEADHRHAVVLGRRVTLTLLEGRLLAAFMARPGEVLDRRALLTSVSGSPFGARSAVSAYIRRLRLKIEPDPSNPVFIRTVWGAGYLYRPERS